MSCQIFEYITDFSCHKDTAPQFISERYLKMRRQSYYSEDCETTVGYLMYNVSIGYPRKPTICKKQWHFNTTFKAMWTATLHRCQKKTSWSNTPVLGKTINQPSLESNKAYASDFSKIRGEMMQSTWSNKSECLILFSEDFVQLKNNNNNN